jgi:hypothetical protein
MYIVTDWKIKNKLKVLNFQRKKFSPFSNSHKCIWQNAATRRRKPFQASERKRSRSEKCSRRTRLSVRHPTCWTFWSSRTGHTGTQTHQWIWKTQHVSSKSGHLSATKNYMFASSYLRFYNRDGREEIIFLFFSNLFFNQTCVLNTEAEG